MNKAANGKQIGSRNLSIANNKLEFDTRNESPSKMEMTDFVKREVPNPMDTPQANGRTNQPEIKTQVEKF